MLIGYLRKESRRSGGEMTIDNWSILGIPPGSTEQEIKSAFRKKALKVHPDVGGSDEAFKELYAAFEACLHSVEPEIEINLNEIFKGTGLAELFRQMDINAYAGAFDLSSLVGMKVRFTFDPTSPNYHDHRAPNELGEADNG